MQAFLGKIRWDHSDGTKLLPLRPLFSCSQTSLSKPRTILNYPFTTLQSSNVTGRKIPELAMEVSFAAQIPYPIESPQVAQRTHVILLMAQDMPAREANLSPWPWIFWHWAMKNILLLIGYYFNSGYVIGMLILELKVFFGHFQR